MSSATVGRGAVGRDDRAWVPTLVLGSATVILGIILLINPFASAKTLAVLVAIGILVHGVLELMRARQSAHPVGSVVAGGLLVLGGLVALFWPGVTLWAIAVVVGLSMLVAGIVKTAAAIADRRNFPGWPLLLASGLLSIVVGVLALAWPTATIVVLAVIFGLHIMILGFLEIMAALKARQTLLSR